MGITDALVRSGRLARRRGGFALTANGEAWFEDFGIELAPLREMRRHLARRCLDWSERREHLAGALGAALAARLLERGEPAPARLKRLRPPANLETMFKSTSWQSRSAGSFPPSRRSKL